MTQIFRIPQVNAKSQRESRTLPTPINICTLNDLFKRFYDTTSQVGMLLFYGLTEFPYFNSTTTHSCRHLSIYSFKWFQPQILATTFPKIPPPVTYFALGQEPFFQCLDTALYDMQIFFNLKFHIIRLMAYTFYNINALKKCVQENEFTAWKLSSAFPTDKIIASCTTIAFTL